MPAAQIRSSLAAAATAEDCVNLAVMAEQAGETALQMACLERSIALDRNANAALLMLAATALDQGDNFSTAVLIEEAARVAPLPPGVESLRVELLSQLECNPDCEYYLRTIGKIAADKPEKTLKIVLITNLFPPQEFGGYGRMMWEFAQGLRARGHAVRVLTANEAQFGKAPTEEEEDLESGVFRSLKLAGTWVGGRGQVLVDMTEIRQRMRDNAARVRTAIAKSKPDLVLAGNLDLLGVSILRPALEENIPVLHALANATPGFGPAEQPTEPHYWVAPCSDWNGDAYRQAGYSAHRIETLYPGARLDRFFRFFLPDTGRLRICYASLVLPYKGAHTLVDALVRLHDAGIDFSAEIAGDAPDAGFVDQLKALVAGHGMEAKVRFTGFLDRGALSAMFARSNVLVFPSIFEEPFGISQVEAMAAGLVVVSSGTGGAKEIVRHETDGLLFKAGDAAALAASLERLSHDTELFQRLQRSSQSRAASFSVQKAVARIEVLAAEMQSAIEQSRAEELAALP